MTSHRFAAALVALLAAAGCKHVPTQNECTGSDIHHDLAVNAINQGNMQEAYGELEQALQMCETNSRVHNTLGVLLHNAFHKPQDAVAHYQRALELDPQFSEARVNLGNAYLELKQYKDAITQYEAALNDMRYPTPFIAEGNLGMAYFRDGDAQKGVEHIKAAVTMNPKFCLGYRNLGSIYEEQGKVEDACRQFARFRESCPDAPEAYYREAVCLAKLGDASGARQRFAECEAKSPEGTLKDDCRRLGAQLQ